MTTTRTMRAIAFDRHGGPDVLRPTAVPVPEPAAGQVRVRVEAAGVNVWDTKLRAAPVVRVDLPHVPGLEVAGVVDAVGADLEDTAGAAGGDGPVRPGDRVVGFADTGGYAELALTSVFARVPDGVPATQAAGVPVASETALRVLRLLDVRAGETLLVHGATGSVGAFAVQLAVRRGARVVGTASPAGQARVAAMGAIPTTYGPGLVDRVRELAPGGVDAVLDAAGRGALPDSIALRGGTDRIVTIADPAADELGVRSTYAARRDARELAEVLDALGRRELTVTVGWVLPLEEAARAHELLEAGRAGGKIVLVP
ncbi:NADP-dependent oxidoreductase [Isoptericola variabilis]|uniref:NADPH:quinone reductase n=1 Tax=Isoptericola variabilis (strain 225) TaxID=743718 RepID=F6FQR9_ISOV2|nr:NADP-dependent oxidoreductase [Isoptericola variabilis]AEG42884.1 NADPH:quinone reductase [Isoptericola variabilis 225]TWH30189.1 NADPH:quinone reductase-like Zn-dependent oxidoreductase [Isoptericola variabilis J7]